MHKHWDTEIEIEYACLQAGVETGEDTSSMSSLGRMAVTSRFKEDTLSVSSLVGTMGQGTHPYRRISLLCTWSSSRPFRAYWPAFDVVVFCHGHDSLYMGGGACELQTRVLTTAP